MGRLHIAPCYLEKDTPRWKEPSLTEPILGKCNAFVKFRKGPLPLGRFIPGQGTWLDEQDEVCISVSACLQSRRPSAETTYRTLCSGPGGGQGGERVLQLHPAYHK